MSPTPEPSASAPSLRPLRVALVDVPMSLMGVAEGDEPWVSRFVHARLYGLDDAFRPVPSVAASLPVVSVDGLTWTIRIRDDVTFHDGSRVAAADAAFSLELLRSPACIQAEALCRIAREHLVSVATPDPMTLVLSLDQPFAPLLADVLAEA
ncbi:MAG: hypothetical protein H0V04_05120, partial [Chloroflexi bacterium]|nr:hypothetical protein [Chloroflexota bacterium]